MTEPHELLELVRRWVQKAENDLRNAEHTIDLRDDCPYDTVCFHSQQCAEKYLKSLLVLKQIHFPKTHDLNQIYAFLPPDIHVDIPKSELDEMTPYAVQFRYPDDWFPMTRERALRAIEIARRVRQAVRAHLPPQALDPSGR